LPGVWPLSVGVRRLLNRNKSDVIAESAEAAALSAGILTVALFELFHACSNGVACRTPA